MFLNKGGWGSGVQISVCGLAYSVSSKFLSSCSFGPNLAAGKKIFAKRKQTNKAKRRKVILRTVLYFD